MDMMQSRYYDQLFALDHSEYKVEYFGDNMIRNEKYQWAHASLDGELTDQDGSKGNLRDQDYKYPTKYAARKMEMIESLITTTYRFCTIYLLQNMISWSYGHS